MHYISTLEKNQNTLLTQLAEINKELSTFMTYLSSSKFAGDGKDNISSTEVFNYLRELRMKTLVDIKPCKYKGYTQ
jgi:hypothetical protein